jgi:hypothetical protein
VRWRRVGAIGQRRLKKAALVGTQAGLSVEVASDSTEDALANGNRRQARGIAKGCACGTVQHRQRMVLAGPDDALPECVLRLTPVGWGWQTLALLTLTALSGLGRDPLLPGCLHAQPGDDRPWIDPARTSLQGSLGPIAHPQPLSVRQPAPHPYSCGLGVLALHRRLRKEPRRSGKAPIRAAQDLFVSPISPSQRRPLAWTHWRWLERTLSR